MTNDEIRDRQRLALVVDNVAETYLEKGLEPLGEQLTDLRERIDLLGRSTLNFATSSLNREAILLAHFDAPQSAADAILRMPRRQRLAIIKAVLIECERFDLESIRTMAAEFLTDDGRD